MPHSHYAMDSDFSIGSAEPRRELMRIFTDNDATDNDVEALIEAKRLDSWKRTSFYEVQSINSSARSDDKEILTSRVGEPLLRQAT